MDWGFFLGAPPLGARQSPSRRGGDRFAGATNDNWREIASSLRSY
jgi:hypothetical protein